MKERFANVEVGGLTTPWICCPCIHQSLVLILSAVEIFTIVIVVQLFSAGHRLFNNFLFKVFPFGFVSSSFPQTLSRVFTLLLSARLSVNLSMHQSL